MWRQGDVFIEAIDVIPKGASKRPDVILAEGAVTGHRHEVEPTEGVKLMEREGTLFLAVTAPRAAIIHPEHGTITLKQGNYRIWRQREYTGKPQPRFVMD